MSASQVAELRTIEPWSHEYGFRAFARRHRLKVNHVYYVRRKLGLPVVHLPRHHANNTPATPIRSGAVTRISGGSL